MQFRHGTLRDGHTPETIGWYLLAFASYLGVLVSAEIYHKNKTAPPLNLKRWFWGIAILFRLLLFFTTPTLSDDVYRYLWDGYVAHQGVSPYAHAIDSPALDYLDNPTRAQANNAWMASPYLPAAQIIFWGTTALRILHPVIFQIAMVGFDLASAYLITRLLALAALPTHRVLLYLWNPLVIVEVAHSAHIDAWMIFLTLLAVFLTLTKPAQIKPNTNNNWTHTLASPIIFALATLTKIIPVLLSPILFWHWNWRQRFLYPLLSLAFLIPFGITAGWGLSGELNGTGLFGALRIYSDQWNFNSGLFHWLERWLGNNNIPEATDKAKFIVVGTLFLIVLISFILARTRISPRATLRLMALPLMGYIALIPTLNPWYALILLAFLPFLPPASTESWQRWLLPLPWLYLSGALIFSYLTYLNPLRFGEIEWVRQLEWLPTLALFVPIAIAFLLKAFSSSDQNHSGNI